MRWAGHLGFRVFRGDADLVDLRTARGSVAGTWRIGRSRIGRAIEAMRSDPIAAQAMGVNLRRYRLGVPIAAAALAGLAGALSAHATDFIGPNDYGFEPAVAILAFA